jgi:hypothetical protein
MSRVGLTLDHHLFDIQLVWKATKSIMLTRDGHQRAAMPNPIGQCVFLNDLTYEELRQALQEHKELIKTYPRDGQGLDAYIDQNDYLDDICSERDTFILTNVSNGEIIIDPTSSSKSSTLPSDTTSRRTEKGYCTVM